MSSQTFFSKLDVSEKNNRLSQLVNAKGKVTVWQKGKKEKHVFDTIKFDKDRQELVLDSQDDIYANGTDVLCSFDLRGMTFFSQVVFRKSVGFFSVLHLTGDLFKSERRTSFRLMTYPLYDVWADFDLGEKYAGASNIIDLNSKKPRGQQTKLFQNFIRLAEGKDDVSEDVTHVKIRIQDISTTGMAIHVGELETKYFVKDRSFRKVPIYFTDEIIEIPEVKIVYTVNYISNDKNVKRYKVGCHFEALPAHIDDRLGKKINQLLRENDFNKDFENFIK